MTIEEQEYDQEQGHEQGNLPEGQQEQEQEGEEEARNYEEEARRMGWTDRDEWDGEEEKWIDAETFVRRGEEILPIVQANNKRLKKDLLTRDQQIASLKKSVDNTNKTLRILQKQHQEATKAAVEKAKKELKQQLREAREIGDFEAEEDIREQLDDLRQQKPPEEEEETEETGAGQQNLNPEFLAWQQENPWFTDTSTVASRKKIRDFIRIGEDLRDAGDTTVGREFMDKCMAILQKRESGIRPNGKVEGGQRGRSQSGGRPFDRLPKVAKAACHEDNENFVGPGKMFKTVKEWEDHFASMYTSED